MYDLRVLGASSHEPNVVAKHVGEWGGRCTCPDGSQYDVSDNADLCGSLACPGGTSGDCMREKGPWSHRKVTCGARLPPRALLLFYLYEFPANEGVTAMGPVVSLLQPLDVARDLDPLRWDGPACPVRLTEAELETAGGSGEAYAYLCFMLMAYVGDGGDDGDGSSVDLQGCLPAEAELRFDGLNTAELDGPAVAGQDISGGGGGYKGMGVAALQFSLMFAEPPSPPIPPSPPLPPPMRPPPYMPPPPGDHLLPPYATWQGGLTSAQCSAMLRDPTHLFRRMWAAEAWGKMGGVGKDCWEVQRDGAGSQSKDTFFEEVEAGEQRDACERCEPRLSFIVLSLLFHGAKVRGTFRRTVLSVLSPVRTYVAGVGHATAAYATRTCAMCYETLPEAVPTANCTCHIRYHLCTCHTIPTAHAIYDTICAHATQYQLHMPYKDPLCSHFARCSYGALPCTAVI